MLYYATSYYIKQRKIELMDVLKIRKSLRMTQAEFADAIGVDKSVVYKYEHGLLNPSKKRREKIDYIVSLGGKDTAVVETEYFDNDAGCSPYDGIYGFHR